MAEQSVVAVRGEAQLEADPELAVLDVVIEIRDRDRSRGSGQLAEQLAATRQLIAAHGEAVESIRDRALLIAPQFRDSKARGAVAGYLARGGFAVTLSDFAVLADLTAELAARESITLTGPSWQLRPDSPARREARLAAVRDAITRANEYAQAFGGQITGLTEISDVGLGTYSREATQLAQGFGWIGSAEKGSILPKYQPEPVRQTIIAQVEARFTMIVPPAQPGA